MKVKGAEALGDFTVTREVIPISLLSIVIGLIGAGAAWVLLRLIAVFTNLFFYLQWSAKPISPADNHLGGWEILAPVIGALIVGVMARYGSEKIRGHGIPEALESILISGSRVEPKVAVLKPVSAAISIGSGGPFGAEGPIIVTGGACGSLIAQFFHLTSAERKTLLVAGAAAGMSATFSAPVAAVLLAVEILLFEWKPRSLIPVGLASFTAAAARNYLLGTGPLFPVPTHPAFIGGVGLLYCLAAGLLAGGMSVVLTSAVYGAEDAFHRLPIHWMWWPALGGIVVGVGGLIFPRALGVGYDNIGLLLQGDAPIKIILGIFFVKSIIWAVSLGSGTSGGVLAPLLMVGCALGGVEAMFFPHEGLGFWPLITMGAVLGGTMRAPLTGIIFSLELTHDMNAVLPLAVACVVAHCFSVLVLKRSILTEKVARRGYHLSQEYSVDPLEILLVKEVMRTNLVAFPADGSLADARTSLRTAHGPHGQHLYPVITKNKQLAGVITRKRLRKLLDGDATAGVPRRMSELSQTTPMVAYPDEPLRTVVYRMSESGFTRFPVVDRGDDRQLLGIVSLEDLLRARSRSLAEERTRERVLRIRLPFGSNGNRGETSVEILNTETDL